MASVADAMRNPPFKTTADMATMPLYSRVSRVGIITTIVEIRFLTLKAVFSMLRMINKYNVTKINTYIAESI